MTVKIPAVPALGPRADFARLYAPLEKTPPAAKLRRLLRAKFQLRAREPEASYLHTAAAADAVTAGLMTDLGFEAVHASGWQLAAARGLPPVAPVPGFLMAELVRELGRGIEGLRDRHFHESGGGVKEAPPVIADLDAPDGPAQAFTQTRELIRAGAAGVCLGDRGAWAETLTAVKAAARAMESELVVIVRTAAIDRALEAAALGADVVAPELGETGLEGPREFAARLHEDFPEQALGFSLSPALPWGEAKRRGRLPKNRDFGTLGYALQFSTTYAFRTAGMALESWLRGFKLRGLDALADLQMVESGSLDAEPSTRRQARFAGLDRWQGLENAARAAVKIGR